MNEDLRSVATHLMSLAAGGALLPIARRLSICRVYFKPGLRLAILCFISTRPWAEIDRLRFALRSVQEWPTGPEVARAQRTAFFQMRAMWHIYELYGSAYTPQQLLATYSKLDPKGRNLGLKRRKPWWRWWSRKVTPTPPAPPSSPDTAGTR